MKSSRLKAPSLTSRLEFERCIDDLARTTVVLRKLEAKRDEQIQKIRAEFEPSARETSARVDALLLMAQNYAEEHREELLPGKTKSAETPLAFFGFRLGQPTLKLLSRAWNWDKSIAEIKRRWKDAAIFIRKVEEPDKEKLKQIEPSALAEVGLRVDQNETFFVEPKDKPSDLAA